MKERRGLVISGGGAFGAYAGGVLEHLINDLGREYDIVVGTSTGSLMAPLAALGDIETLKEAYTNVTNEDIFKVNPFKPSSGDEEPQIKLWNAAWRILRGEDSLGDSSNLRKTIEKFITRDKYDKLQASDKQVIACVTNLTLQKGEYKPNYMFPREDFMDWMYASACVPGFMSTVDKAGCKYVDGGIVDHAPIQETVKRSCKEVDVIVLRPKMYAKKRADNSTVLEVIRNTIGTLTREISQTDVKIAQLSGFKYDLDINFWYTPEKLAGNSLNFNKEAMQKWWKMGYENACKKGCVNKHIKKK